MITSSDPYQPDSPYAYRRLGLSLLLATIAGSGMWCITVVLTEAQKEFGVDRAAISIAYTLMMLGFATGTIVIGRMVDRTSICLADCNLWQFSRRRLSDCLLCTQSCYL